MAIKEALTSVEYLGCDSSDQHVFRGWAEGNKPKVIRTHYNPNYFFVLKSGLSAIKDVLQLVDNDNIQIIDTDAVYAFGKKPVVMLEFVNDYYMSAAKADLAQDAFEALEYIDPVRRFRIDNSISVPDPLTVPSVGLDIEVDARAGFPQHKNPIQRLLGIAFISSDGLKRFVTDDDEHEIFKESKRILGRYRIATGWNLDGFDKPYMNARAKEIGIDFHIPGVSYVDAMKLYKYTEYARGKSARLDDTAKRELNRNIKTEFESLQRMQAMYESFVKKDGRLKGYCLDDAKACYDILMSPKLQLTDMFLHHVVNVASCDYGDAVFPSRLVEQTVLKHAQNMNPRIVFPSEHSFDKSAESFEGGKVIDPLTGLWHWVVVFDFRSLYNRIMQTWNIGLDSYIAKDERERASDYISTPSGALYCKLPSVYRTVLKDLETMRNVYKTAYSPTADAARTYKTLNNSYKMILLSVWGVIGQSSSRLFSQPVAESIAACGRYCLTLAEDFFKRVLGCNVVYGDSDSCMVVFPSITDPNVLLKSVIPMALQRANEYLKQRIMKECNIPEEFYCIELECEKVYDKYYIPAKKRYIGRVVWKEGNLCHELFTRGFEIAKFSAFELYKSTQKKVFDVVFRADTTKDIIRGCNEYFDSIKDDLFSGKLDEKLVVRSGVHSLPTEYKSKQPYITAAKKLVDMGMFRVGDIVKYVISREDKHGLDAEPIIDKVPNISHSGYLYYWERLTAFRDDLLTNKGGIANTKLTSFCEVQTSS